MGKKKKKKNGKLPYVHINVIPEEEAAPGAALPANGAMPGGGPQQGARPRGAGAPMGHLLRQPDYDQYPSEVISASESGLAKQSLSGQEAGDEDEEIAPFVIPVFRKSDIQQAMQGHPASRHPGYPAGQFPSFGQNANPRSNLAQIQNDLLAQHNAAQQQASQQPLQQRPADRQAQQPYAGQQTAMQQGAARAMGRGSAQRQANPRQTAQAMQATGPLQAAAAHQASQQHPAAQTGSFQPLDGSAAQARMHQSAAPAQQGYAVQQKQHAQQPQGQRGGFAASQQGIASPAQGAQHLAQQGGMSSPGPSQQVQGGGQMRQPTGQFAPVGPSGAGSIPPQSAASGMQPTQRPAMSQTPSSTGTMQAVASSAAARAEQVRMHAAFGSMQVKSAQPQGPYPQTLQGPRQAMQQAASMQAGQPQATHSAAPQPQASTQETQPSSAGAGAAPQPASQQPASSTSKVGDPLLDPKAIEESTMFDKPPVSIEEGMRKSESGRKARRRIIVAIVAIVVLLCAGVGAYLVLSQQGVVPQISIETKTVPVTPQGSNGSSGASSSSSAASSSAAASSANGTGTGDLSGTVVYQYSANTASGVRYQVEETVTFQANGDCQSSEMRMTFPDEASAKTFTDNLARDYGSSFRLDSLNGVNAVVTIDNSGLHLSRDEYENALRYSVSDLVVLGK